MTIVEGYEMTGKTTRVQEYQKYGKKCMTNTTKSFGFKDPNPGEYGYISSWELTYPQSWIIGASIFRLGAIGFDLSGLVLDRGILSTIVYHKMKSGGRLDYLNNYISDIIEYSKTKNLEIELMVHKSKDSALKIFNAAKKGRNFKDSYDDKYFDNYWTNYVIYTALMADEARSLVARAKSQGGNIVFKEVKIEYKDNKEAE